MKRTVDIFLARGLSFILAAVTLLSPEMAVYAAETAREPAILEESVLDPASAQAVMDQMIEEAGGDPWYLSEGKTTAEQISREDMLRYLEDGTFWDRLSNAERQRSEMEKLQKSYGSRFINNLSRYIESDEESCEGSLDAQGEFGKREPVTGGQWGMPSTGSVNSLVFFVDFKDYKYSENFKNELKERMFMEASASGEDNKYYPRESLTAYYQRASYGLLNIKGDFFDYTSEHNRNYYDTFDGRYSKDIIDEVTGAFAKEIQKNNDPVSTGLSDSEYLDRFMSKYDQNHDNNLDSVYFCYAGGNNGWGGQWWPVCYSSLTDQNSIGIYSVSNLINVVDTSGKTIKNGDENIGDYLETFIHETGHNLGLPDYYSYESNGLKKTNTFAMMDDDFGDQDGFAKMLLGWLEAPQIIKAVSSNGIPVSLKPYSKNGDVAIILPEKEYEENKLYSQFILAEFYVNESNDRIKEYYRTDENGDRIKLEEPEDGLRLYHIYARLNADKNEFLALNTVDDRIPLISAYRCSSDRSYGFFRAGDELSAYSDPSSAFYRNMTADGLFKNTVLEDSGISIRDITEDITDPENKRMNFFVSFNEVSSYGPKVSSSSLDYTDSGYCLKVNYDMPVNVQKGTEPVIYDYDAEKNTFLTYEKWGTVTDIRRSLKPIFSGDQRTVYYMIDDSIMRYTSGVMKVPGNTIVSSDGVAAQDHEITFVFDEPSLSADKEGGLYDSAIEVSISGQPEGTDVYYTLNGDEPTFDSTHYENPIKIENSSVLKAVSYHKDEKGNFTVSTNRLRVNYTIENISLKYDEKPLESIELDLEERFQLKPETTGCDASQVSYSSSDISKVYVDNKGLICARKETGEEPVVITLNTPGGAKSLVNVYVKKDIAKSVKDIIKNKYGDRELVGKMAELAVSLGGSLNLKDFYEKGYADKNWIGAVPDQIYSGKAIKPSITAFHGIEKLSFADGDYSVSYKKNKAAGTAVAKVRFKGNYKDGEKHEIGFTIKPAELGNDVIILPLAVKVSKKNQKPKPVLLNVKTGEKIRIKPAEFEISYFDDKDSAVDYVKDEGNYTVMLAGKNRNYAGSKDAKLKVAGENLVEKLKIKKLKSSFDYTGERITPEYGKDFVITLPSGFDPVEYTSDEEENKGKLEKIKVQYYNNLELGKMAMVITSAGDIYGGSQVVYFTIKKARK